MILETKEVLLQKDDTLVAGVLYFAEEVENSDDVYIKLEFDNKVLESTDYDFFNALIKIRTELEIDNLQIRCNGAAENVYPSPMMLSMGAGRKAYYLVLGEQAKKANIVDIFECNNDCKFVTIQKQREFYNKWINSLR